MRALDHDPHALVPERTGSGPFYANSRTIGEGIQERLAALRGPTDSPGKAGMNLGMVGLGATVLFGLLAL